MCASCHAKYDNKAKHFRGGTMVKLKCETCGSREIYWVEEHPDTGMDEMVLRCKKCESRKPKLPLRFRASDRGII